jgi:RNA polymerase sigma-70 factor, ECF subfamily
MEELSDAATIAASLHEPGAFAAIYDRHAAVLFRFLVRRVGADVADSLLGDVFRIGFERRSTFDQQHPSARPWLYGIANNVLAKHRRSEARRLRAVSRLAARETPAPDPSDALVQSLDAQELWVRTSEALAQLPDGERDALLLFAWEDLGYEEIAVALAIPVGTVRSRLNRARRRLRELVEGSGEQEGTTATAPRERIEP